MKIISVLVASLMAATATPAMAASDDAIAKEIVYVYQTMCVNGIGKPEKFNAKLKKLEDAKTILRMPEDQTKSLFKTKGVAWTTKTESDAELLVTHEANGVCAVRVRESDEDALKDAFEVQVKNVAKEVKGESVKVIDEKKKKSGAVFSYYEVITKGAPLAMGFGISTESEKTKTFQHILTFNLAKPAPEKK